MRESRKVPQQQATSPATIRALTALPRFRGIAPRRRTGGLHAIEQHHRTCPMETGQPMKRLRASLARTVERTRQA